MPRTEIWGRWKLTLAGLIDDQNLALWPSIGVLFLLVLLLVTFVVLPVSATERHYLTTSPLLGFLLMSVRSFTLYAIEGNRWSMDIARLT